jgi:Flp pilus assembly protein CpaB
VHADRSTISRFAAVLSASMRRTWWGLRRSATVRRALLARVAALAVVVAVVGSAHQQLAAAAALRRRWEPTHQVLVTTRDVPLGAAIDEHNTELQDRPLTHLPDGALSARPSRRRATTPLERGEVVTGARVSGRSNVAAAVPDGHSAVAVAVQTPAPRIEPGDHVQLLAAALAPVGRDGSAEPARTVSHDAVVLSAPEPQESGLAAMGVAVPRRDVAAVAGAALGGPLAVVVSAADG